MTLQWKPDPEVELDKLEEEWELYTYDELPKWAYLQSEWNERQIKKVQMRKQMNKLKEAISAEELYYESCNRIGDK